MSGHGGRKKAVAGSRSHADAVASLAVALILVASSVHAEPVCVSTPEALTAALSAAQSNGVPDEIQMVAGTYGGSFSYASSEAQGLTIRGGYDPGCLTRSDDPSLTILDGGSLVRPLALSSSVPVSFALEGFTIRNGHAEGNGGGLAVVCDAGCDTAMTAMTLVGNTSTASSTRGGGGIYYKGNTLTLAGCVLTGNSALKGGGLLVEGAIPSGPAARLAALVIENCFLEGNSGLTGGGGIYAYGAEAIGIRRTDFSGNDVMSGEGGGLYAPFGGTITMEDSSFGENVSSSGGGFNIYAKNDATLVNCAIWGNSSAFEGSGGGGRIEAAQVVLTGNTLADNNSSPGTGALHLTLSRDSCTAKLYNNVFWGNTSPQGADLSINNDGSNQYDTIFASVEIHHNDFDQSDAGFQISNKSAIISNPAVFSSNLDRQDPLFLDPTARDYRLGPGSPCIDAGDGTTPLLPATDHDGLPRVSGAAVDMGAWERPPAPPTPAGVAASDGLHADRVAVTWDAAPGAEGYRVFRAAIGTGEFSLLGETGATQVRYEDVLACGTAYTYRVIAFNYGGESAPSAEDAGSTGDCPPVPLIGLSTTAIEAACVEGENAAGSSFLVSNAGTGTLDFTISDDAGWLSCEPAGGSAAPGPVPVTVTYATAGLAPGTYEATITVSGNAANSPLVISVTVTVSPAPPPEPLIGLSTTAIEAACVEGENAPGSSFQVFNAGTGTLDFSVSDNVDWLSCEPAGGSAAPGPVPVAVTYATAGLSPGTYEATISVSGNAANSPLGISVSVTISPEPPPDPLRFFDDFSDGAVDDGEWRLESGAWRVNRTLALKSPRRGSALALVDGLIVTTGRIGVRSRLTPAFSTTANAAVVFARQAADAYRYVRLLPGRILIGQKGSLGDGEESGVKVRKKRRAIRIGRWNDIRVDIHPGGLVEVARAGDGRLLASYAFPTPPAGEVGFLTRSSSALFDDLSVWDASVLTPP